MTDFVNSWPTARTHHRCSMCRRLIRPGESYWRQAGLDRSTAWTNVTCAHCERMVYAYCRDVGESEWIGEVFVEWLADEHPNLYTLMRARWAFPDGALVGLPFGSRCVECGTRVEFRRRWCGPCDEQRIARIGQQLTDLRREFSEAAS